MRQNTNTALHTAAFLVVILCLVASAQDSSVIMGVLEDNPGHSAGDPHYRSVRVVFYKQREKWEAFPSNCPNQECLKSILAKYPKEMAWTVVFDGKTLGSLESRAPKEFDFYSTVGQQTITSNAKVPTVGEPSEIFCRVLRRTRVPSFNRQLPTLLRGSRKVEARRITCGYSFACTPPVS